MLGFSGSFDLFQELCPNSSELRLISNGILYF